MTGWVITRNAADGTKRYDACWWVGTRKKSKTFTKRKAAENYLTAMVKRVQDGTYVEVVPAPMGEIFDRWRDHSLEVRLKEGSSQTEHCEVLPLDGRRTPPAGIRRLPLGPLHAAGGRGVAGADRHRRFLSTRDRASLDSSHVRVPAHRPGRRHRLHRRPGRTQHDAADTGLVSARVQGRPG